MLDKRLTLTFLCQYPVK